MENETALHTIFSTNNRCGSADAEADYGGLLVLLLQTVIIITLSHILHMLLKRVGQPSPISQMLAGIIMGPTLLARLKPVEDLLFLGNKNRDYISSTATMGRQIFMFLIGLEMDIQYLFRSSRNAAVLAYGGALVSASVAAVFSPLIYWLLRIERNFSTFVLTLMAIFSNTASPILVRMTAELKLTTTEIGRSCLVIIAVVTTVAVTDNGFYQQKVLRATGGAGLMAIAFLIIRPLVRWINRRNRLRRHIKFFEFISLLLFVMVISSATEVVGYNAMMACFLMGLLFPREGSTARTLIEWLTYPVHNFILPIYFGYTGMQTDLTIVHGWFLWGVVTVVVMSTIGKIAGTVAAARHLKIPFHEGLVLGFLLNVKGHVDLIVIALAMKHNLLSVDAFMALISTVVLNTLITGPAVALVVRRERKMNKYRSKGLEWEKPETQLRMVACVHGTRDLPAVLSLIEMSSGTEKASIAAYVLQLVELTAKTTSAKLYHQQEDDEYEDDDGADEARQINAAVDAFTQETGITIRQVTAVSAFANMHEDICNGAKDVRASLVVLPFHKFQRVDGKMITKKHGLRSVNAKTLSRAPCTVGILVDREGPAAAAARVSAAPLEGHQVVALFFGGPDDREAVAYGGRMAVHPLVSLTVVRFLPASRASYDAEVEMEASKGEEVLIAINNHEKESEADEAFLSEFYTRFVVPGTVSFVEKTVANSLETLDALRGMEGMYALYLVGRGGRRLSPFLMGLNDWEECPELGPIGDLLASSDFPVHGSVLVLQQNGTTKKKKGTRDEDEFAIF
ncbi:unnamed protein product [Spirodela intermedia]|uniref:Uncharacterized protein n=1 Tax=Spirodela intermedia TaxID=51605 RepID=A0A7I8JJA0_SPIIN|nr:unnamed protein product [Spirodela intermedia]CAA6669643.1 unnamed protein product [Spirodela intermedia]